MTEHISSPGGCSPNAHVIGTSRITMEMASEKQIPGRFVRLSHGQPANPILLGIILTGALIIYDIRISRWARPT